MANDQIDHFAYVEAWFKGLVADPKNLASARATFLFERAMRVLWRRAELMIGAVTLSAIVDRVICIASEKYPMVSSIKIEEGVLSFGEFRRQETAERHGQLGEAMCFVLAKFLTVLGNLTDEILTASLHAELSRVTLDIKDDDGAEGPS